MRLALQYVLSALFIAQMYVVMVLMALVFIIPTMINSDYAVRGVHTYCAWVRWTAKWMVGLESKVVGEVPQGEVLVAAKHQSFFDIIVLCSVLPRPRFIMKAQLRYAPIVGWFAMKIGCIPVNRGKRAQAIRRMVDDVNSGREKPGQLVIYPQGTRVGAGAYRPYKIGTAVLYEATGQTVVPVATNVGVFWPRHGLLRKPGVAVFEFLDPVRPGMEKEVFMAWIEEAIERRSNQLMKEAGLELPPELEMRS